LENSNLNPWFITGFSDAAAKPFIYNFYL
jgi:hypothetical protein